MQSLFCVLEALKIVAKSWLLKTEQRRTLRCVGFLSSAHNSSLSPVPLTSFGVTI
jgi:hypothetical protein